MLRLKCVRCGLLVPYKGSSAGLCPRCLVREDQAVELIPVSDLPSSAAGRTIGRLTMSSRVRDTTHTIVLSGELDVTSAEMLDAALAEACAAGAEQVVVDLSGVEFMDSTGLNSILRGRRLCEERGCEYVLTPAQRPVERVFEITGLRRTFRRRAVPGRGRPASAPDG